MKAKYSKCEKIDEIESKNLARSLLEIGARKP